MGSIYSHSRVNMSLLSPLLGVITSITIVQWCLLIITLGFLLWRRQTAPFKKYSNFPQVPPHWLFGNNEFGGSLSNNMLTHYNHKELAEHRYGLYWDGNNPSIFVRDIDLIKRIQVVDFDHFTDFGFLEKEYLEKVGNVFGIADMQGEHWRKMKKMVTPPFSVPRMKKMLPTMNVAAERLRDYLKTVEKLEYVNAVDFSKKFYMTAVASVAFGLDIDCFGEKESEFEKKGKNLISVFRFILKNMFPSLAILFKIKVLNPESEKFFADICKRIVQERKNNKFEAKDILGNLMHVAKENPDMTDEMMYKTCVQFFTDGYETASQATGVLFYHLARNPDIQERAQEEIDEIFEKKKGDDHIDESDLNNIPYLDQVLSEGLRLGAIPMTNRYCTMPYKVPDDDYVIPKDMKIVIPTVGLHYDAKYWENPLKFDPERFNSENKGKIEGIAFQPFGQGPRNCLGQNLMKVETKIMLIHLLRNFRLKRYGDMPEKIVWDPYAIIGSSEVQIKVESRL